MQQLVAGTHEVLSMQVTSEEYENHACDLVLLQSAQQPRPMLFALVCDSKDYSKVYRTEAFNPKTATALYTRERSDFRQDGFPRKMRFLVRAEEVEHQGVLLDELEISDIRIDAELPSTLFRWNPPTGYSILERIDRNVADQNPIPPPQVQKAASMIRIALFASLAVFIFCLLLWFARWMCMPKS